MEDWQKDLLSRFAEVKLKEAIDWLLDEWKGDIREIPKLFGELYTGLALGEWIGEEIYIVELDTRDYDEELACLPEPDGYINEDGGWILYPWADGDV